MVRATLPLAAVLLAGGCATRDQIVAAPRYSIVGSWAFKDPLPADYRYDETDCGTDFAARYDADGIYHGYEQQGRWSLKADTLTEVVTHELGMNDDMVAIAPRTHIYRLRWLSADLLNAETDGGIGGMIRCPALP